MKTGICFFCGEEIEDGREVSGYMGTDPDWMIDGDFGCSENPINDEDGTGSHCTRRELLGLYVELERAASYGSVAERAVAQGLYARMRQSLYGAL